MHANLIKARRVGRGPAKDEGSRRPPETGLGELHYLTALWIFHHFQEQIRSKVLDETGYVAAGQKPLRTDVSVVRCLQRPVA